MFADELSDGDPRNNALELIVMSAVVIHGSSTSSLL